MIAGYDLFICLGFKAALLRDVFMQKYFLIEKENSDLKFENKVLELQLRTLKYKKNQIDNENSLGKLREIMSQLEIEFGGLICDQQRVFDRIERIVELFNFSKCNFD